jgi:hypothetical protein
VVIVATAYHERWRDEVVPLSIAREIPSIVDLWRMVRHEGHPILWYLVLRYADFAFGTASVLPILSVGIAIAAVVVLLRWAPLPLWITALFVFGYFPLYEYSVIARANGLAMLSLFAFCALYLSGRHPIGAALALVALANSTALGFIVAAAAGVMVVIDAVTSNARVEWSRGRVAAVAICVLGLAHAIVSNAPDPSVVPFPLYQQRAALVATSFGRALINPVASSAYFYALPLDAAWIWLLFLLLLRRPGVLAFAAISLLGFELVFALVYPASERHVGYPLLVIIAALWLGHPWSRPWRSARGIAGRLEWIAVGVLVIPLAVALGRQIVQGAKAVRDDVRLEYSSSKRLAAIIAEDPDLHAAIVIGEPETVTQSLPYYRDNRIFLPQENAFRNWLQFQGRGGRRGTCDLGELLATASSLRDRYGVPVILALGWTLDGDAVQQAYVGSFFAQTFTMSEASRAEFVDRTELLGRLRDAAFSDENYDVYVLR